METIADRKRLVVWHCERCTDAACECAVESGKKGPSLCPCGFRAEWRDDRWRPVRR